MPKLIVSIDGIVVKEVQLTKDRSTVGRRPYNDVVIDNLAVSGEHAAVSMTDGVVMIEDLGSTNGTYVNGKAVKNHQLADGDTIEVGMYKLKFIDGKTLSAPANLAEPDPNTIPMGMDADMLPIAAGHAKSGPRVRVLTGGAKGREMDLTKVVTTIGKPGLCVASITRRAHGFDLAHVDGMHVASVNGTPIETKPVGLKNHDQIDLGGIRLEFIQA